MRDRRQLRVRRLAGVHFPELLRVPRAELRQELPADAPAIIGALDDVHPARLVAAIRVVVAGEEIAHVIESKRLGIAQAFREQLELRPVRLGAKHRAIVLRLDRLAALRRHARAAVGDRPVEPAVGAHLDPVHVVPAVRDVHAEAGRDRGAARCRLTRRRRRGEFPEVRDAGEIDVPARGEHARRDAGFDEVEALSEDDGSVRHTVAVAILHEPDALGFDREILPVVVPVTVEILVLAVGFERRVARVHLSHEGPAIRHRAKRERRQQPVHVLANVRDRSAAPPRLHDISAAVFIERKRDDVLDQRLGRPEVALQARRDREAFAGQRGLDRSRARCRRAVILLGGRAVTGCWFGPEGDRREQKGGEKEKTEGTHAEPSRPQTREAGKGGSRRGNSLRSPRK